MLCMEFMECMQPCLAVQPPSPDVTKKESGHKQDQRCTLHLVAASCRLIHVCRLYSLIADVMLSTPQEAEISVTLLYELGEAAPDDALKSDSGTLTPLVTALAHACAAAGAALATAAAGSGAGGLAANGGPGGPAGVLLAGE